jgi:large subunit ribosomal protein L16
MLQPKKTKFRKMHKMIPSGNARRGTTLSFGSFGLKAIETGWLTQRQIEAARVALTRNIGRDAKIWIRIFPDKPITKKPAEVRMGKGKGNPEYWVAVVKAGRIIFEADGVSITNAKESFRLAGDKLPILTKFVVKNDYVEETKK